MKDKTLTLVECIKRAAPEAKPRPEPCPGCRIICGTYETVQGVKRCLNCGQRREK